MIEWTLKKLIGTKNERELKKTRPIVVRINELENQMRALKDEDFPARTAQWKQEVANGRSLDDLLPEAFAFTREAARRVIGQRHYDVQMVGGLFLHQGNIAEMRTGEGKTLTATLPSYLNALSNRGVHVVTVNDYLARRDAEWMGRVYHFLGMTTGCILHELNDRQRQESYRADITYGQNNEFGFDYLRDNMKFRLQDYVQRELNFAIVDEVDSILIDEARTPLIISGPTDDTTDKYYRVDQVIPGLIPDQDFLIDEKARSVSLTDDGIEKVQTRLGVANLYAPEEIETLHHVEQGLRAHALYKRDRDYVVRDGEVIIVDEFTGRLMAGRRWSDGLHQAVEAKEGVKIENENQTLATISFQNYFRMYSKLSGMTGTADTEAEEFASIYKLDVRVIPTNRPNVRKDHEDVVYKTEREKFVAMADEMEKLHQKGQPVLVGTVTIAKSEAVAGILKKRGIPHNVLNAKQHEREAHIVAQAGRKGAITISTNMAGRGTDILLGGNPEVLARDEVGPKPEVPEPTGDQPARSHRLPAGDGRVGGAQPAASPEVPGDHLEGARRGEGARRPAHPRHRTPRVPPHRQPAPRPRRPSGRSRRVPLLSVPRRRPDAHLRVRAHLHADGAAGDGGGRADRAQVAVEGHRRRPEARRRPQLRHAQEPARVRRRDEPAAAHDLQDAPPGPRRRRRPPARRVRRGQEDPREDPQRADGLLGRLPRDGARRGRGRDFRHHRHLLPDPQPRPVGSRRSGP